MTPVGTGARILERLRRAANGPPGRWLLLLLPGGLALLGGAAAEAVGLLEGRGGFPWYGAGLWAAGLLLAWRFRRGRAAQALLLLALFERLGAIAEPSGAAVGGTGNLIYAALGIAVPFTLALWALLPEGRLFSQRTAWNLAVLLLEAALVGFLCRFPELRAERWFSTRWVAWDPPASLPLGQPALLAWGLSLAVLGALFLRRRGAVDAGYLWSALAVLAALSRGGPGPAATLYVSAGVLALGVSVVEASYAMAYRDDLTGLPGRRALGEALRALPGAYTVAMVDVDHFKDFNDRFGHDAGDQVLRLVAARLARVGGGGKAFRYGGEEFTLLFPGAPLERAEPHLEVLRRAVAASTFTVRGPHRPRKKPSRSTAVSAARIRESVTVSIGAASAGAGASNPEEVLKAADRALYRAKAQGRNRVCI